MQDDAHTGLNVRNQSCREKEKQQDKEEEEVFEQEVFEEEEEVFVHDPFASWPQSELENVPLSAQTSAIGRPATPTV